MVAHSTASGSDNQTSISSSSRSIAATRDDTSPAGSDVDRLRHGGIRSGGRRRRRSAGLAAGEGEEQEGREQGDLMREVMWTDAHVPEINRALDYSDTTMEA